jgi:hypothetical protein
MYSHLLVLWQHFWTSPRLQEALVCWLWGRAPRLVSTLQRYSLQYGGPQQANSWYCAQGPGYSVGGNSSYVSEAALQLVHATVALVTVSVCAVLCW